MRATVKNEKATWTDDGSGTIVRSIDDRKRRSHACAWKECRPNEIYIDTKQLQDPLVQPRMSLGTRSGESGLTAVFYKNFMTNASIASHERTRIQKGPIAATEVEDGNYGKLLNPAIVHDSTEMSSSTGLVSCQLKMHRQKLSQPDHATISKGLTHEENPGGR